MLTLKVPLKFSSLENLVALTKNGDKYMVMEDETLGGEPTVQYTDVLDSCTPEIHIVINQCYCNRFLKRK